MNDEGLRKGDHTIGPFRDVVQVLKVKKKRGQRGPNYVIVLECGHKYTRGLWRDPDQIRCCDCSPTYLARQGAA